MRADRIDKLGLEIECGVEIKCDKNGEITKRLKPDQLTFFKLASDGSIGTNNRRTSEPVELVSIPLNPADVDKAIDEAYKHINEINNTMGFHVHMSFKKDEDYWKTTTKKFFTHIVDSAKEEYPEWIKGRFSGKWCVPKITEKEMDIQIKASDKNGCRYKALNYCKGLHNTIEFRFFKATQDKEEAKKWVSWLTDTVEGWLDENDEVKTFRKQIKEKEADESTTKITVEGTVNTYDKNGGDKICVKYSS